MFQKLPIATIMALRRDDNVDRPDPFRSGPHKAHTLWAGPPALHNLCRL